MIRKTEAERWLGRGAKPLPKGLRGKRADMTWKELQAQIRQLPRMLDVAVLNFTVDVAKRALVVFQHSFKEKRFYSGDGEAWKPLSKFTIGKRIKRGTWPGKGGMLQEYGVLYDSMQIKGGTGFKGQTVDPNIARRPNNSYMVRVYTNPSIFSRSKYHKGFVYAGIHNNPDGDTYGNGFGGKITPRKAIKRQFIGFSTYIDQFEDKYIDRYLFHQIFNKGGGGLMSGNSWESALNMEE